MHASHLLALPEPDEGQRKGLTHGPHPCVLSRSRQGRIYRQNKKSPLKASPRTSVRDAMQHSLLGALRPHSFQVLSLLPSEEEHQVPV